MLVMYHVVSGLKYARKLITNTSGILDFEKQDEIMPEMKERISLQKSLCDFDQYFKGSPWSFFKYACIHYQIV